MIKEKLTTAQWFKKYWRGLITALVAIFIVVSAVLADGWSDNADKKAWWVLWEVWWGFSLAVVLGIWSYHWFFNPKKRNR
jgi:hypothetical protein